jgi:hypothetical protein
MGLAAEMAGRFDLEMYKSAQTAVYCCVLRPSLFGEAVPLC